jgi:putative Holliday junction resolvase
VRVLGVDFGLRNLGLALSDPGEVLATPLRSLRIRTVRDAPAAVALVVREVEAGAVVVGAPEGLEGEEGRAELRRVKRFATALRRETGLPVHMVDESLSSREAWAGSGRARDRDRASAEHAAAAAVILQRWLDRPRKDGGSR